MYSWGTLESFSDSTDPTASLRCIEAVCLDSRVSLGTQDLAARLAWGETRWDHFKNPKRFISLSGGLLSFLYHPSLRIVVIQMDGVIYFLTLLWFVYVCQTDSAAPVWGLSRRSWNRSRKLIQRPLRNLRVQWQQRQQLWKPHRVPENERGVRLLRALHLRRRVRSRA